MRTFKFADDESYKFWKIELSGTSYTVTYGRIGTKGQTSTKSFPTPEKAKSAYEKIIAEKLGKGYIETTPVQAAPKVENALETALFANPDDIATHAAYADWLSERGDPRGEFINVQMQLEDLTVSAENRKKLQDREKKLLDQHATTWLGGLAGFLLDPKPVSQYRKGGTRFRFARGWLDSIAADSLTVNLSRALVQAPELRLLRELRIEYLAYEDEDEFEPGPDVGEDDPSAPLSALQRLPTLPNLRVFYIGEPDEGGQTHIDGEPAVDIVERMPNLEELHLFAHNIDLDRLFSLPLDKLRHLQVDHCTRYPLKVLAQNASLSNLTRLAFHPHAMEYEDGDDGAYIGLAGVRALMRSSHLRKLEHLQLRLSDMGDAGIQEFLDNGHLKRLKTLDLSGGVVTDAGARLLAASPDIKNLQSLDLSMNRLTQDGIAALQATGVKIAVGNQYGEGEDEYLFMGDME